MDFLEPISFRKRGRRVWSCASAGFLGALLTSSSSGLGSVWAQDAPKLAIVDLPRIDSSTSTQPLAMGIACAVTGAICDWVGGPRNPRRLLPEETRRNEFFERVYKSGTRGAYRRLIEAETDLVFVARRPAQAEHALAREKHVHIEATPVAVDGLVFLVEATNPVDALSLAQIRAIYAGEIRSWSDLGGRDAPIDAIIRNDLSGSQELLRELVLGENGRLALDRRMLMSMMATVMEVDVREHALAFSVLYYDERIAPPGSRKRVAVSSVAPSSETLRDGSYPLRAEVFAAVRSDLPKDHAARRIVKWLATTGGRAAIEKLGYVAYSARSR